jgi:uncharacterized RDD family membrane protein YckC
MIPVIGLVTWGIVGVLGLGAATLASSSAYRRENPRAAVPPSPPAPDVPPPPVPVPYVPHESAGAAPAPASVTPPPTLGGAAPPHASSAASFTSADAPPGATYAPPPYASAAAAAASVPLASSPSILLTMPRGEFRDRLAACVLDIVLVGLISQPFEAEDVFIPFLLIYHIGFWTWRQTTAGGMITQLRIVKADGTPLSFADALVRGLAGVFSVVVLLIGFLWILKDPDRQSWHDKIAGTYVVKVPRNWPH